MAHDVLVTVATWILNDCSTIVTLSVKWNHYDPSWLHHTNSVSFVFNYFVQDVDAVSM